MAGPKAVEELVASVRSNLDVIRDAMKDPMTDDSHQIVSELMLDVKQSQELLQKRASELVESGNFANTSEIFETIDLVTNVEPQFETWSRGGASGNNGVNNLADSIGASIHAAEVPKKKKKKKKNRDLAAADSSGAGFDSSGGAAGGWEAFPLPPGGDAWPVQPVQEPVQNQEIAPRSSSDPTVPPAVVSSARLSLGMTWEALAPLLGDPGSTDEVRKQRLGDLMKEAIATECGITLDRIRIRGIC